MSQDTGERIQCPNCHHDTVSLFHTVIHCGGTCADKECANLPLCFEMVDGSLSVIPASTYRWGCGVTR